MFLFSFRARLVFVALNLYLTGFCVPRVLFFFPLYSLRSPFMYLLHWHSHSVLQTGGKKLFFGRLPILLCSYFSFPVATVIFMSTISTTRPFPFIQPTCPNTLLNHFHLFTQLLCSTCQSTTLFMFSTTIFFNQPYFQPTNFFLATISTTNTYFPPFSSTNSANPFAFFTTMCLTNLTTTSANLFFFNLSFSATFHNHFLLPIQPFCNQPILPIIFSTIFVCHSSQQPIQPTTFSLFNLQYCCFLLPPPVFLD